MKKNKYSAPRALVAPTRDTRAEGTFEVLVPVPNRVKPYPMPLRFPTQQAAESWIHSPEGVEMIDETLAKFGTK
jgi:hypothetical protein